MQVGQRDKAAYDGPWPANPTAALPHQPEQPPRTIRRYAARYALSQRVQARARANDGRAEMRR